MCRYAGPLMIDGRQVGVHVQRFPPSYYCLHPNVRADIFLNIAGGYWDIYKHICAASTMLYMQFAF